MPSFVGVRFLLPLPSGRMIQTSKRPPYQRSHVIHRPSGDQSGALFRLLSDAPTSCCRPVPSAFMTQMEELHETTSATRHAMRRWRRGGEEPRKQVRDAGGRH